MKHCLSDHRDKVLQRCNVAVQCKDLMLFPARSLDKSSPSQEGTLVCPLIEPDPYIPEYTYDARSDIFIGHREEPMCTIPGSAAIDFNTII